jgi:hypothetical protein
VLTLDQLGISEEDWNNAPASMRAALMFLLQQNQRMENRCYTYELEVQRLKAGLERLKRLELEVAELRERLGQNSQNSSRPPSSESILLLGPVCSFSHHSGADDTSLRCEFF